MSTKTINTRIQMKHDSAEKWSTSTFVPFEGEIIFYSDLNKIKIGDGSKNVNELPFITIDKTDIIEFINHNHDGQYYTEKEVDSLISALEILLATKYDNSSVLPAGQIEGSFGIALIPNTTNVYSLGTSEKNWKNIYLSGDLIFGTDVKINSTGITLKNNSVLTDGTNSTTINDIVNHNHNSLYYQKSEVDSKIIEAKHTITADASDDDVVILTGTNGQNAVSYTAAHSKTNKAGTYTKVTVNDYGHVTSGENPTTLSDYGITDVYTKSQTDSELAKKLPNDTLYAGSSSTGGSATSAVKLDTATAGSTTQPVYFSGGKPVATTYSLAKSVPADAVFTDTTYENATASKAGLMSTADKTNLDKLVTAWTADGNDDQLINKVEEVVKAFENAPEGTNIVTALANKADNTEATQAAAGLMSATDKKKLDGIAEGAGVNVADTDETITLVKDLYAYTNIGKISASNTNPKLVAVAGSTLKTVFNTVFGTQQDEQPSINTDGVSLSKSQTTVSAGGGEFGTSVPAATPTITFTLNNSATASYGYRCGNVKTVGSARFKYAITKQSNADIKITLPSGQTASSSMVTAGTYVTHSGNILYCNFDSSNKVSIKVSLVAGSTTTNSQTRYGTITGSVILGEAWSNDGTTSKKIDKFLTYLGNDATTTSYYSGGTKENTTSSYTISAGSKYVYWAKSTSTTTPTSWTRLGSGTTSVVDMQLSCSANEYIWVATTGNYTYFYAWNDASGKYNTDHLATAKSGSTISITNKQNVSASGYYTYRTQDKMLQAVNTKFKLQ